MSLVIVWLRFCYPPLRIPLLPHILISVGCISYVFSFLVVRKMVSCYSPIGKLIIIMVIKYLYFTAISNPPTGPSAVSPTVSSPQGLTLSNGSPLASPAVSSIFSPSSPPPYPEEVVIDASSSVSPVQPSGSGSTSSQRGENILTL